MRATTWMLVTCMVALFALAPAAMADTLTPRATPFAPSQSVADQYTVPPGANPSTSGGTRGVADRGATAGDQAGEAPDAGQAPDTAGQAPAGATAPARAQGTLPFTGSDLLALVWIALALVAAGSLGELARRRIEARRSRVSAG